MSLIAIIIGIVGALLGALAGHRIGKSDGVAQASQTQQIEQSKATVQAVKERVHVEATVATVSDVELDARLSKYDRPD